MKRFYSIDSAARALLRIGLLVLCGIPFNAHADLFVGTGAATNGTIGQYSDSGLPLNPSLISGLRFVRDIAISGNKMFVLSSTGTVGVYTTSGQTINASLITGLHSVEAIAVSGSSILIGTDTNSGTVAKYTTAGTLINPTLITGLSSLKTVSLGDMTVSRGNLFVSSDGLSAGTLQGIVGKYTLSGVPINPALVTFSNGSPTALAVSGSNIFVRNSTNQEEFGVDTIAQYTIFGTLVNPSLITGLTSPFGIAVSDAGIFVAEAGLGSGRVGEHTISGEPIAPGLITDLLFPSIAVSGPTTIPDQLSTFWLAVPIAVLVGAKRLLRYPAKRG